MSSTSASRMSAAARIQPARCSNDVSRYDAKAVAARSSRSDTSADDSGSNVLSVSPVVGLTVAMAMRSFCTAVAAGARGGEFPTPPHGAAGPRGYFRAAVAGAARGEYLAPPPQVAAVHVGPQHVEEHHLGVRRLPQQEVARALLAGGAQEQVDVRHVGLVQVPRQHPLVH